MSATPLNELDEPHNWTYNTDYNEDGLGQFLNPMKESLYCMQIDYSDKPSDIYFRSPVNYAFLTYS